MITSRILSFITRNRKIVGWSLLAISIVFGFITLYKGILGDEADNLVVGSLLLRGYTLFRDIFSHHFPFPYYWVAIIVGLFGKSIFVARLSILVFQTTIFAFGMRLSGDYLLLGIAAVIWSIVRSFYSGNMVLYSSFAGAAVLIIFITIVVILQQRVVPSWKHWLLIGLFSIISILSDPLSVYAVGVALVFLFTKRPIWGVYVSLVIGAGLLMYAGYLYFTGSIQAFWSDAILFNTQIYAKYIYTNPLRFGDLLSTIIKGLGITDAVWLNLDPLKHIIPQYTELDHWFFTGFLYRFSVIATTVFLALRKQYRTAAFTYLFTASALIIEKWGFRAQPFILVSILAISALITNEWWRDTGNRVLKTTQIIIGVMVLVMTIWLSARLSVNIYKLRNTYGDMQLADYKRDAFYIEGLTCNQPNVLLGYYPDGNYWYWFTGMKPVSKYVYLWPWVAEVGLNDVIHELSQNKVLAIVVRQDFVIWGAYDSKEYLHPLDEYLDMNYHKISEGVYVSPKLYALCPK